MLRYETAVFRLSDPSLWPWPWTQQSLLFTGLDLTYHQTKFSCKSISNLQDTVQAATFWLHKPCGLDLEDSKLDSGSCWCTTILSLIIKSWEVQKILSGFYTHRWDTHTHTQTHTHKTKTVAIENVTLQQTEKKSRWGETKEEDGARGLPCVDAAGRR